MVTKNTTFYRSNFVHFPVLQKWTHSAIIILVRKRGNKMYIADLAALYGEKGKQYGFRKKNQSNSTDL